MALIKELISLQLVRLMEDHSVSIFCTSGSCLMLDYVRIKIFILYYKYYYVHLSEEFSLLQTAGNRLMPGMAYLKAAYDQTVGVCNILPSALCRCN